ncbi:MAG: hypothetical protein AAGL96_18910 [Pseudomonadota bacterium]
MKQLRPIVSDHAVLRYIERVYGVDIEGLRKRIERITDEAREKGASGVNSGGVSYKLSGSGRVITVTGTLGRSLSTRAERWKRRRS